MKNKYFDGKSFIISLAVGLFFVYITVPDPEIIYVYPTPDNVKDILYKDKADVCHRFISKETVCPARQSMIQKYPIQGSHSLKSTPSPHSPLIQ